MKSLLVALNITALLVILLWAFYNIHVSDWLINRISFIFIALTTTIVIIAHLVPNDSPIFYQNYIWQRLLFNLSVAFRCCVDVYCQYGSVEWKEAFRNSRNRLFRLAQRNLTKN